MDYGSGSQAPGAWRWPDDLPDVRERTVKAESVPFTGLTQSSFPPDSSSQPRQQHQQQEAPKKRHWRPRTCRICLETVLPTFHPPSENLPSFFHGEPNVTYESEDSGRLLRPCKCKGSAQYVHEGCLQSWRHADPGYARRNYFQCPTCGYRYRLQWLGWGRMISSVATQITLTLLIVILATFVLGFMADPIIEFALDPYGAVLPFFGSRRPARYDALPLEGTSWIEHFTKGFASLGLLSFLKALFASPMQFFFRSSGVGHRTGSNGRERLSNLTWLMIIIGVATFLYAVWKGVRAWSRRTLEKAGERVMDVQVDDDSDDDDDDDDGVQTNTA